jgi:DedD protein
VGAFKNRQQAEAVQQALLRAGFPTEVSLRPAEEGQARYRVRVGAFGAKAEAERMAERLRAERSLATYVTSSR